MKSKKEPKSLESLYSELESIVEEFERGDIPLQEALKKFRAGVQIAKKIKMSLKEVETEIEEIKLSLKEE